MLYPFVVRFVVLCRIVFELRVVISWPVFITAARIVVVYIA